MILDFIIKVFESLAFGLGFTLTLFGLLLMRQLWWKSGSASISADPKYIIGACFFSTVLGMSLLWGVLV